MKLFLIAILGLSAGFAVESVKQKHAKDQIRVLPVKATPEAEASAVLISLPKNGAQLKGNPVWVQLKVEGFAIGAASQFDRADEIAVSDLGQTFHVVVDNMPYFPVNEPALDPFNEEGWYYETRYKFELPMKLSAGEHVLRVFLARSFGESLKGERTFAATTFNIGSGGGENLRKSTLSQPYITYNEPSNEMHLEESTPILLDFYISNCELTPDGYKVQLIIDGDVVRTISSWQPYYIYGLTKGKHTVRLELLNGHNKVLPGVFNDTERSITVY